VQLGGYNQRLVRIRAKQGWAVAARSLSVFAIASCSSGGQRLVRPDAGGHVVSDPRAAVCARVDAGGPVPFAVVQQVFNGECISCHDRGADLALDDNASWGNLVNHAAPADEACGGTLVVPGDASASYLFQKLSSSSPCSGLQMSRGELGAEPLPVCVINLC
jgi:hypothetical protein